ncbi:hypothetical protein PENSPDRAFT_155943 [Peniophora sp. CONT]|nr:hypothetical protein PENSPDRAFT_155943 [Peniophora sp. CONT]
MFRLSGSSIYKLDADILAELFTLIARTDPPGYLHNYPSRLWDPSQLRMGWTRLSHVCSLWREILTRELPSLWAEIVLVFPHEEAYATMLRRAQDIPIALRVHRSLERSTLRAATFDFIRTHCHRAHLLDLPELRPPEDWSDMFNPRALPQLRDLRLRELGLWSDPIIPALHIQAPGLVTADFRRLRFPANVLHSPSLVRLKVTHSASFRSWHLLGMLGGTPLLESLQVTTLPASFTDDWPTFDDTSLSLLNLRKVHVSGGMKNHISLLRLLSRSARIRQLDVELSGEAEDTDLHEALDVVLPSLAERAPKFDSLFVHHGRFHICAFHWQEYDPDTHSVFLPPGQAVWFSISLYSVEHSERARLVPRFCAGLRLADIEHLVIQWGTMESTDLWASLSSVTSITFMVKATNEETAAIREIELLGGESRDGRALLFPRLQTLKLCACAYSTGYNMSADNRAGWWRRVIDMLITRRQNGAPVHQLIVCDVYRDADDPFIKADEAGMARAAAQVEELVDGRTWIL